MLRKLVMAVVAIIALLVIAVVLVVVFIDPNDYRDQLSAQASDALGRPVSLSGPLNLKVFPRIALEISDVTVGNPEGFPADQPLAQIGSAVASVQLLPLLQGQVNVGDVTLNDAAIHLLTVGRLESEKVSNLAGLVAEEAAPESQVQTDLSQIQTGAIQLNNVQITQSDLSSGESQNVSIDSISLGAFRAGQNVPLRIQGNILQGGEELIRDLDIEAELNVAADLSRIGISNVTMEADLPTAQTQLNLSADGALTSLDPVILDLSRLSVDVTMEDGTEAHLESPLQVQVTEVITVRLSALQANAKLPDGTNVTASSPLSIEMGDVVQIALAALDAHVEIPQQAMDVRFKGPLNATVADSPRLVLGQSVIQLNGQEIQAQGSVVMGDNPRLDLTVSGDTLDLNPFIAATESTTGTSDGGGAKQPTSTSNNDGNDSAPSDGEPDLSALRSWTMDVDLRLQKLLLPNLSLEQVVGVLKARDGLITLDPLSARLFQGQFEGLATVDTRQNPPEVHLQPRLQGVAVQALLLAFSPTAPARGAGSLDMDIRFSGLDIKQALKTLQGAGQFTVADGAILGVDLNRLLNEEISRSNFSNISESFGGETVFESLSGQFNAESGVLQLPAMNMDTLQFGLDGQGSLDLAEQTLNYDMTLNLGEELRAQMPKRLMDVTNGVIPLTLSGPVTAPIVSVNLETLVQSAVKKQVKKRGKKLLNNLFKRLDKKSDEEEAEGDGGG